MSTFQWTSVGNIHTLYYTSIELFQSIKHFQYPASIFSSINLAYSMSLVMTWYRGQFCSLLFKTSARRNHFIFYFFNFLSPTFESFLSLFHLIFILSPILNFRVHNTVLEVLIRKKYAQSIVSIVEVWLYLWTYYVYYLLQSSFPNKLYSKQSTFFRMWDTFNITIIILSTFYVLKTIFSKEQGK